MRVFMATAAADRWGGALPDDWRGALGPVLRTAASQRLREWLGAEEAAGRRVYPPAALRFRAFELTPLAQVRVVILGQDPYHGAGQAHGLAFSVPEGVRVPPSLVNIRKELVADCGIAAPGSGDLTDWARQGVLLLNTVLTVEESCAGSHQKRGWEAITDAAVAAVAARPEPCVFMLWGAHAQRKALGVAGLAGLTGGGRHLVLTAPHPSSLSARTGFFGCRHFSRANAFLAQHGRGTIEW
jgi:uracil-DNA glycosylase